MARARKKAPRQEAPQNLEEATALAERYIYLLDMIDVERNAAQVAVDRIIADRAKAILPKEEEAKAIFRQLRPWWAANRDELTDGKRKSIELAGAQIGERTSTPALALPKGLTLDGFTNWLLGRKLVSLIRTKHTVDKPACIKALRTLDREPPAFDGSNAEHLEFIEQNALGEALADIGASVTQKDEFFIDRIAKQPEGTEAVDVESEGDAA
jgi:phage host-nuclease inhibitor protein Gam